MLRDSVLIIEFVFWIQIQLVFFSILVAKMYILPQYVIERNRIKPFIKTKVSSEYEYKKT